MLRELRKLMPHERFIFVADQRHVPYGGKTAAQLRRFTGSITRFLLGRGCKIVVVACNTGTVYAIEHLRRTFTVPFVGTVPAIKPAIAMSKTKTVAILSTPATAVSPALKQLVKEHARGAHVLRIGCVGLEEMVERGVVSGPHTDAALRKHLAPAVRSRADVIVLGCTHYPFMRRRIAALSGARVIDSGKAIARRTQSLLMNSDILNTSGRGSVEYFTNGSPANFSRVASKLLRTRVKSRSADV